MDTEILHLGIDPKEIEDLTTDMFTWYLKWPIIGNNLNVPKLPKLCLFHFISLLSMPSTVLGSGDTTVHFKCKNWVFNNFCTNLTSSFTSVKSNKARLVFCIFWVSAPVIYFYCILQRLVCERSEVFKTWSSPHTLRSTGVENLYGEGLIGYRKPVGMAKDHSID